MLKRFHYFILILFLLPCCRKLMHDEEISFDKITSYDQLCSAAIGVYASLTEPLYSRDFFYAPNLKGDDINVGNAVYNYSTSYIGTKPERPTCYKIENYSGYPYNLWESLYSTIASANNIISQYNLSLTKDQPTRKVLGEMYLIRAYCHFRLTRVYGQVPIIDNSDVDYNVPKPSFTEIYRFIENDLKTAMQLLPENNSAARIPFVTTHRGSAKAILAEVYLSWAGYPANDASKYNLAAKEAGETIDSASYFGLGLVSDFTFLWDKQHLYNSESVFSLYCDNHLDQNNYWDRNFNSFYKCSNGTYIHLSRETALQINFFPVEINFYNSYPACYRKEITFCTTVYYDTSYYDKYDLIRQDTGHVHIDKVSQCNRMAYRKFYYERYEIYDSVYHQKIFFGTPRVYIFRYTQTVLTYAEAMARSGQLNAKAYECVNQIRRRAHHADINSPSAFDLPAGLSTGAFADSVVRERAWELCAEPEGRWFDLVRLEMVENLSKMRHSNEDGPPNGNYSKSAYFFPTPPFDIILNPNLGK
jgi:starch-binding outer membrane protein, SusD/RagB family